MKITNCLIHNGIDGDVITLPDPYHSSTLIIVSTNNGRGFNPRRVLLSHQLSVHYVEALLAEEDVETVHVHAVLDTMEIEIE